MGCPAALTTVSPGRRPARAAGLPASTRPTTGVRSGTSACEARSRSASASEWIGSTTVELSANCSVTCDDGSLTMRSCTSSQVRTGCPEIATIRAPGRMDRRASAPGGSESATRPTTVVGSISRPFLNASPTKTSQANTTFMVTPARMTTMRFHTGCASNTRSGGTGVAAPPSSMALAASSSRLAIFT